MTEEEFYELKSGDEVEYNGVKLKFTFTNITPTSFNGVAFFENKNIKFKFNVYKNGNIWTNTYTLSDDKTLGNLKLIKKNSPTIDQKIAETKSEIEKLQEQLKKLESEKNSKKIEQLISEMIPGNFYTIKYTEYFHPNGIKITGRCMSKEYSFIHIRTEKGDKSICIESIKDIILREELTNDYNKMMEKMMEKIKQYNGETK